MTRTGTLAFSRIALLATLVGWAGVAQAQSSTQSSRANARWEAQGDFDHQPSFRRADSSAGEWQPTRSEETSPKTTVARSAATPKAWLTPTPASGRGKAAAAKSNKNNAANQSTAQPPKAFVPPTDAKQITNARPGENEPVAQEVGATSLRPASAATSAAQASNFAPRSNSEPASNSTTAQRPKRSYPQQSRVAHRPRPAAAKPGSNWLLDDSWIRPLRQVAYQEGETEELYAPPGSRPQNEMRGGPMSDGPMMGPEMHSDGEWIGSPDGGPYGGACCDGECGPSCGCGPTCGDGVECCSTCGRDDGLDLCTVGPHDDEACDTIRIRLPKFQELMILGGVHGFKGPFDRQRDSGNFGFQEGFNVGAKLPFVESGYQFGYQAAQSQLSGDGDTGIADSFAQHFFTTGVFHRERDGFQGGAVWDLLLDERESSVAFSQIRAEFGFVDCGCHEIGATIAVHLKNNVFVDSEQETTTAFQSVDQYLLYYRMHGKNGGEGRVYGGLTDDADGLVGADFALPLTDNWSLQPAFTYLIPKDNGGTIAAREEAWNIGINLVWHWRGHARSCHSSPYRPLFNVADNGYMIIDNRP